MQSIQQMIMDKLTHYSKSQKILANFILENLHTVPLLSVNELAEKAGVSSATVVRFARVLGFQGYLDFRNRLSDLLKKQLSPVEKFKAAVSKKEEYQDSLNKTALQVVNNINQSLQQNDLQEFKNIVEKLKKAENIYCIGMGVSRFLADIMAYLLRLYLKRAYSLPGDSQTFEEQILLLTPRDLLIAFSFPHYSRQTVEAAQLAHESNIPVVSFTDKKTAPIVQYSHHILIAKTDNILFTNSLGAISVLMNALVTELALTEGPKMVESLKKIEKYFNDPRYYFV